MSDRINLKQVSYQEDGSGFNSSFSGVGMFCACAFGLPTFLYLHIKNPVQLTRPFTSHNQKL